MYFPRAHCQVFLLLAIIFAILYIAMIHYPAYVHVNRGTLGAIMHDQLYITISVTQGSLSQTNTDHVSRSEHGSHIKHLATVQVERIVVYVGEFCAERTGFPGEGYVKSFATQRLKVVCGTVLFNLVNTKSVVSSYDIYVLATANGWACTNIYIVGECFLYFRFVQCIYLLKTKRLTKYALCVLFIILFV